MLLVQPGHFMCHYIVQLQLHWLLCPSAEDNKNNYENFPATNQRFSNCQQTWWNHPWAKFSYSNQSSFSSSGACRSTNELIMSQSHIILIVKEKIRPNHYHQQHEKWQSGRLISSSFDPTHESEHTFDIVSSCSNQNETKVLQNIIRSTMHIRQSHENMHSNADLQTSKKQKPVKAFSFSPRSSTLCPGNDNFHGNLLKERYCWVQELMRYQCLQTNDLVKPVSTPSCTPVSPLSAMDFGELGDDISTVPSGAHIYRGFRQPLHKNNPPN